MKTTFEELKELFHLKDNRQILKGLLGKIILTKEKFLDNDPVDVDDEELMKIIEKFRIGGCLTFNEVCEKYNVGRGTVLYMNKLKLIPYYKLTNNNGSQILYLCKDLDEFDYSRDWSIQEVKNRNRKSLTRLVVKILNNIKERYPLGNREYELFIAYFIHENSIKELSKKYDITEERIRQILSKAERRIAYIFMDIFRDIEELSALRDYYNSIKNEYQELKSEMEKAETVSKIKLKQQMAKFPALILSPDEMNLSVRTSNCLKQIEIKTVSDLISYSSKDLLKYRGFGKKSLNEIINFLTIHGLELSKTNKIW